MALSSVFFEELFHFQRGHAAGAGSGDGLTVAAVLDVAAGKDAGDGLAIVRREDVAVSEDVAVGIQIELAVKHLGVGNMADAEEEERHGKLTALAGHGVAEVETANLLVVDAENLFDHGAGEELDGGVGDSTVEH